MAEFHSEKRHFTRVEMALPAEVHQGGSIWHQRLIDISVAGVTTDRPDPWDAQYNEPFTVIITLENGSILELHVYLQHAEAGRLGFCMQHVDRENIGPLLAVLEAHMDSITLEEELNRLSD